jgi:hypothetical protein
MSAIAAAAKSGIQSAGALEGAAARAGEEDLAIDAREIRPLTEDTSRAAREPSWES